MTPNLALVGDWWLRTDILLMVALLVGVIVSTVGTNVTSPYMRFTRTMIGMGPGQSRACPCLGVAGSNETLLVFDRKGMIIGRVGCRDSTI